MVGLLLPEAGGQLDVGEKLGIRFVVTGRVQGVFFRDFMRSASHRLNVTGWVRNRSDGAVEGEAVGTADRLQSFREALARGPELARVVSLEVEASTGFGGFAEFRVRY